MENVKEEPPINRKVLKSPMSIFETLDPISSFTIRAKILMQNIWCLKIDWDDNKLPENIQNI